MIDKNGKSALNELDRLFKEYNAIYSDYALRIGFPEASLWVLYAICCFDSVLTQYELCKEWSFSKQTINSAVNSLVKTGYIYMQELNDTHKRKALLLTDSGELFCKQNVLPLIEAEAASLCSLSNDERDIFFSVFKRHLSFIKQKTETVGSKPYTRGISI